MRPRWTPRRQHTDRSEVMSMSNRARRMMQHQLRHRADAELNLIPMIDILSVMVSFLLVYSTNVEVLQNDKAIEIPQSVSERQPKETVVVMMTKEELFVQGEPVESIADIRGTDGSILPQLREALKRSFFIGPDVTEKDLSE